MRKEHMAEEHTGRLTQGVIEGMTAEPTNESASIPIRSHGCRQASGILSNLRFKIGGHCFPQNKHCKDSTTCVRKLPFSVWAMYG